jgi:hypothetical protein
MAAEKANCCRTWSQQGNQQGSQQESGGGRWSRCDPSRLSSLPSHSSSGAFRRIMERRLASFCPPSEHKQQEPNTRAQTHTHTHTQGNPKKSCRRERIFNQKKKGPPLSFPTGNNLLNGFFFLPNGKNYVYIFLLLSHKAHHPARRLELRPSLVCVCVCTQPLNFFIFSVETAD